MSKIERLGILGKKIGMTQIFGEKGKAIPVTVLQAGPCTVLDIRTEDKNSYNAIQLGFKDKKESKINRPLKGFFKKHKIAPKRYMREIRLNKEEVQNYKTGQTVSVDIFKPGEYVDITGTSKGRGFTGVVKKYGFAGYPASHGTHECRRHGGSIGCAFPQHTRKGVKMPGQYGNARVTVQSIEVVEVNPETNLLLVKGAVPGANGNLLIIKKAVKK